MTAYLANNSDDSVYAYEGNVRKSKNPFHYSSKTVLFIGRINELNELVQFCGYNSNLSCVDENYESFIWWALTGEGGLGKTRLTYEFMMVMRKIGWTTCIPFENTYNTLSNLSRKILNNTLFVIDYSEIYMCDIFRWISSLYNQITEGIKVRILLIDRQGSNIYDIKWVVSSRLKYEYHITNLLYNGDSFLRLCAIQDKDICKLISNYAEQRGCLLENSTINDLFKTLKIIDPQLIRPIYSLFITDAFLVGNNPIHWKRTDALEYVYQKELRDINERIVSFCKMILT